MAAISAKVYAQIQAFESGISDFGSPSFDMTKSLPLFVALTGGTGANQVDKLFADQRTIAASGTDAIDLSGTLKDPLNNTTVFATVRAVLIRAAAGNTNNVVVGNGTNPFIGWFGGAAHTIKIPPGGAFLIVAPVAGWAVTAATADILEIDNGGSGTSVTYDLIILGTSA